MIAPAGTPVWLRSEATSAATALGDKQPTLIHIFVGRRHDKIVMHGHFRCPGCFGFPGSAQTIPTGSVVVIRFDARTHHETDFGIGNFTGPDRTMT